MQLSAPAGINQQQVLCQSVTSNVTATTLHVVLPPE